MSAAALNFKHQFAQKVYEQKTSLEILARAIAKKNYPSRIALLPKPFEEIFGNLPHSLINKILKIFLHVFEIGQYTYFKIKGELSTKDYFKVIFGKFMHIMVFDPLSFIFLIVEKVTKIFAYIIGISIIPKACAYMMKAPICIRFAQVYVLDKFWTKLAPQIKNQKMEHIIEFNNLKGYLGEDTIRCLSPARDKKDIYDQQYTEFRDKVAECFQLLDTLFCQKHPFPLWAKFEDENESIKKAFQGLSHPKPNQSSHEFTVNFINAIKSLPDIDFETLDLLTILMEHLYRDLKYFVENGKNENEAIQIKKIYQSKFDLLQQRKLILGGIKTHAIVV